MNVFMPSVHSNKQRYDKKKTVVYSRSELGVFAVPESRATGGKLPRTTSSDISGSNLPHFCRTRASS